MRFLFYLLIFGAGLAPSVFAESEFTSVSDYAFQPTEDEGYIQAWNVDFRGGGRYVYVTFLVSNTGPGSLNNGVSTLVYGKDDTIGKVGSRTWTSEFSGKNLKAIVGQFGHKSGPNSIRVAGDSIVVHAENPGGSPSPPHPLKLDLTIKSVSPGVRISGGQLTINGDNRLRADIPVTSAIAQLTLQIGDHIETISGIAGVEAIWANKSPHTYAKRFLLARSFTADQGIFLGGYFGTHGENDFLLRYAILEKGLLKKAGPVQGVQILNATADGFSGYSIPVKVRYRLTEECSVLEERRYFAGGFDVLGSVSGLLRWVLRVFFAKPYVMHYDSQLLYSCAGSRGGPTKEIKVDAQSSYYLVNP